MLAGGSATALARSTTAVDPTGAPKRGTLGLMPIPSYTRCEGPAVPRGSGELADGTAWTARSRAWVTWPATKTLSGAAPDRHGDCCGSTGRMATCRCPTPPDRTPACRDLGARP